MLIHLLKTHLLKYKKVLLYVLGLQIVATSATLMLPRLNADIIDKGVIAQDMPYIYKMGAVMLLVTLVQVGFAIAAVF
ncbi:MAG: ABC transporter ATP-binding protein, partial [Acidimicrobiales bacterium]|nr:ABC transporter ATP-binding protein [Acidimicrobiales bacterium]